jgi:tetratricopeptide (TPR) repeat protein
MKRIISSVVALGACLTPLNLGAIVQPSWAQSQNSQFEKVHQLIQQAKQQEQRGQPRQAIKTWQQILAILRHLKDKEFEALILARIGFTYNSISQPEEALKYFNQAL